MLLTVFSYLLVVGLSWLPFSFFQKNSVLNFSPVNPVALVVIEWNERHLQQVKTPVTTFVYFSLDNFKIPTWHSLRTLPRIAATL